MGNRFEFHCSLKKQWVMDSNSITHINKKVMGNGQKNSGQQIRIPLLNRKVMSTGSELHYSFER